MVERIFAIGDIHGCYDELVQLLEITDRFITSEDKYLFVGDYIDRGPKSKQVIDLLIERANNHRCEHIFLMGNHEDMALNDPLNFLYNGGHETLESYGVNSNDLIYSPDDFMGIIPQNHRRFFRELRTYYVSGRTVFVHAGIDPRLSIEEQDKQTMIWSRSFVNYLGTYKNNYFVVHGHTPKTYLHKTLNSVDIDTACVFGGELSCCVFLPDTGEMTAHYKVKSMKTYEDV